MKDEEEEVRRKNKSKRGKEKIMRDVEEEVEERE